MTEIAENQKAALTYQFDNTDASIAPHLFETLQDLQAKCPVSWTDSLGGYWMVNKYADITKVANDWEAFTVEQGHTIPSTGKSVMLPPSEIDPPLHTSWRRFLLPYFTPKTLEQYRPMIEKIVADAFSPIIENGRGDIIHDVANRVPTSVISGMLGFKRDWNYISEITEAWMASTSVSRERALEAAAAVEGVVKDEMELRRGQPVEDILGEIMAAEIAGEPIKDQELLGLFITFIVAGHGTTVDGISNTVRRLLVEPGLLDAVQADRSILPSVIDESLRLNPPVWNMARTVRTDAEVHGVSMSPGEKVMMTFGAANYDPDKFADPNTFDYNRPGVHGHLTFGSGRHRCLGEGLARLEMLVVIEYLLDNLPDLELDGEALPRTHFSTYGYESLPVRLGRVASAASTS